MPSASWESASPKLLWRLRSTVAGEGGKDGGRAHSFSRAHIYICHRETWWGFLRRVHHEQLCCIGEGAYFDRRIAATIGHLTSLVSGWGLPFKTWNQTRQQHPQPVLPRISRTGSRRKESPPGAARHSCFNLPLVNNLSRLGSQPAAALFPIASCFNSSAHHGCGQELLLVTGRRQIGKEQLLSSQEILTARWPSK